MKFYISLDQIPVLLKKGYSIKITSKLEDDIYMVEVEK